MHWRNSNFGIKQFIAGSCHTADEAYRKLSELLEEREISINMYKASLLRQEKIRLECDNIINNGNEIERLEALAKLIELDSTKKQSEDCYNQAVREYEYIKSLIEKIKPFRKYSHLPDYESHQLTQQEEWKLELIFRAENFLISQGYIPHDQLAAMRQHPEFKEYIFPKIQEITMLIGKHKNNQMLLSNPNISNIDKNLIVKETLEFETKLITRELPFLK